MDRSQPEPDRHRHRLLVVEQERGQPAPGGELVAAVDAGPGADLVAELAQPVDVAAQRARTHPEPLAQLAAGPRAVRLEQGEEPQGAGGGVWHVVEPSAHRGQDLTASTPTVVP